MKVRNKKVILMTMLSSMGIGMLTLSIGRLSPKAAQESLSSTNPALPAAASNSDYSSSLKEEIPEATPVPTTKLPAEAPQNQLTTTPKPIYEFETKSYPEIEGLLQDYYLSKASNDIQKMKELLSDPSFAPTLKQLQRETTYVEDYGNLDCYIKKSYEDNAYIVYVYHEVKYFNINTPAPYLDKFYIITDPEDKMKIYSQKYGEELSGYYTIRDQDADVIALIEETNLKMEDALKKDKDLRIYLEQLSKWISQNNETNQGEGDSSR